MGRNDGGVEVEGGALLRRALRRTYPEVDKELAGELREIGRAVLDESRGLAPRLTGELSASLRLSVTQRRVTIYSRLPQAGVVHWGGVIEPRGVPIRFERTEFLTRAVEHQSVGVEREVSDSIERAAHKAGWL